MTKRFSPAFPLFLAVFLLCADPALAAEGGENKWGILLWLGRFFNLALVGGILVYVARKPLASFLESRSRSIRDQLAEAQRAREQAEGKLAEMESRMARLDEELRELREAAELEASQERQRMMEEAEQDAKRIQERTRQEIEGMLRAAEVQLKAHVAELSVRLAEEKIRGEISAADQDRLFARFVRNLGGGE